MKLSDILLVSDIDGTTLVHTEPVPQKNIEAVRRFTKKGGRFSFATGRSIHAARIGMRDFAPNAPIIVLNGALGYDPHTGEEIISRPMGRDIAQAAAELAREIHAFAGVMMVTANDYYSVSQEEPGRSLSRRHSIITPKIARPEEISDPVYKVLLIAQTAKDAPRLRRLAGERYQERFSVVQSGDRFVELMGNGVSKGSTLRMVADMLPVSLQNIVAIGDNENDISMLDLAAVSAAPRNADERVKNHADMVLCHCQDGALAALIEHLEDRYE